MLKISAKFRNPLSAPIDEWVKVPKVVRIIMICCHRRNIELDEAMEILRNDYDSDSIPSPYRRYDSLLHFISYLKHFCGINISLDFVDGSSLPKIEDIITYKGLAKLEGISEDGYMKIVEKVKDNPIHPEKLIRHFYFYEKYFNIALKSLEFADEYTLAKVLPCALRSLHLSSVKFIIGRVPSSKKSINFYHAINGRFNRKNPNYDSAKEMIVYLHEEAGIGLDRCIYNLIIRQIAVPEKKSAF